MNSGERTQGQKPRNQSGRPPQKKKGKGGIIALIVILAIVVGVFAYWKISTRPPETSEPDTTGEVAAAVQNDTGETQEQESVAAQVRYYTTLVVGIDQLKSNTDTIMLARYDTVEHKVNLISIPRDTLVNVKNPVKKINSVYGYAEGGGESGVEALMSAVTDITGFTPDSYVFIDTQVFSDAIDALGGVYFDVPVDMNYDDVSADGSYEFHAHFKAGPQQLNGEQTMQVFRFRKNNDGTGYGMGDIDRIQTQHDLINAIASQALKLNNLPNLISVAQIVLDGADTNLTFGNMQWYAQEFLKMESGDISIGTLPGNYSCVIRGGSYVSINVDEWLQMVNEQLNPLDETRTLDNVSILVQDNPDTTDDPNPNNYHVTDGSEIAGGVNSFYSFS